jgi:hypothetical protein
MRVGSALIAAALVLLLCTLAHADNADENWSSYRKVFPNHFQTLVLSPPDNSGARTLIISEPPPDTLPKRAYKDRLTAIFRGRVKDIRLKRQEVALHGWIEDIVITVAGYNGSDGDVQLRDDLAYLAETL